MRQLESRESTIPLKRNNRFQSECDLLRQRAAFGAFIRTQWVSAGMELQLTFQ